MHSVLEKKQAVTAKTQKASMRQHQFYKVELVSIVEPKERFSELDRMLNCARDIGKIRHSLSSNFIIF